jgi:hypothetical protein|tara:strand:+ start:11726 stop:12025 length:300 start_codon:yes stop_codon:yes gene_type:complete
MIIYVDIDETICISPESRDYSMAKPLFDRIDKINSLYDRGDTIVYWTARGSGTGIDWSSVTKSQLEEWNVKHHELMLGKPVYDLFICDKAISTEEYFNS